MAEPTPVPSANRDAAPPRWRRPIVVLCVISLALLLAGAASLALPAVHRRIWPRNFGWVQPQLARSGQIHSAIIEETLRDNGIEVIVDLTGGPHPSVPHQAAELAAIDRLGIEGRRYKLLGDGTGDPQHYIAALDAILTARREGRTVLVHCAAGAYRTGGVVAMYRLLVDRWPADRIRAEMQRYGWRPRDEDKLIPYLNAHMDDIAAELARRGLIDPPTAPLPRL